MDDENLIRRAFAAYYRSAAREGSSPSQVSMPGNDSCVSVHDGKTYVVLNNVNGVLAVYRVRNDGILKVLRRWPREIEQAAGRWTGIEADRVR